MKWLSCYSMQYLCVVSIAWCVSGVIRELISNDDGNATRTAKIGKTTILHVHHAFLYISFLSLHDYDVKMPNFTFCG